MKEADSQRASVRKFTRFSYLSKNEKAKYISSCSASFPSKLRNTEKEMRVPRRRRSVVMVDVFGTLDEKRRKFLDMASRGNLAKLFENNRFFAHCSYSKVEFVKN